MTDHKPLVSVIIPTFNRGDLVRRAVQSVQQQSYPLIEIIVVDDASDKPVAPLFSDNKEVRVIRNAHNRGGGYSRNRGLEVAQGRFVNFLDDDDELFPGKIEKQWRRFQEINDPQLGMITAHTEDTRSGELIHRYNRVKGNIYEELLRGFAVSGIESMLFKKKALDDIGGFDETLVANQEYDLLIRFSEKYTVDFVDEVLSKEHRSMNQISQNFDKKIRGARQLYRKHKQRYRQQGLSFATYCALKHIGLLARFYVGKTMGEKMYRKLLFE